MKPTINQRPSRIPYFTRKVKKSKKGFSGREAHGGLIFGQQGNPTYNCQQKGYFNTTIHFYNICVNLLYKNKKNRILLYVITPTTNEDLHCLPEAFLQAPLHSLRVTVLRALRADEITSPYFLKNDVGQNVAVNGECYKHKLISFSFLMISRNKLHVNCLPLWCLTKNVFLQFRISNSVRSYQSYFKFFDIINTFSSYQRTFNNYH